MPRGLFCVRVCKLALTGRGCALCTAVCGSVELLGLVAPVAATATSYNKVSRVCLRLLVAPSNTRRPRTCAPTGATAPPDSDSGRKGGSCAAGGVGPGGLLWLPAPVTAQQSGHFPSGGPSAHPSQEGSASPRGPGTGRAGRAPGRCCVHRGGMPRTVSSKRKTGTERPCP